MKDVLPDLDFLAGSDLYRLSSGTVAGGRRESWVVVGSVSCNRLAITEQEEEEEDWMLEYQDLHWKDECDEEVGER